MTPEERAGTIVREIDPPYTEPYRLADVHDRAALRNYLEVQIRAAVVEERAACAKLVEEYRWPDADDCASHAAAAIRARP